MKIRCKHCRKWTDKKYSNQLFCVGSDCYREWKKGWFKAHYAANREDRIKQAREYRIESKVPINKRMRIKAGKNRPRGREENALWLRFGRGERTESQRMQAAMERVILRPHRYTKAIVRKIKKGDIVLAYSVSLRN